MSVLIAAAALPCGLLIGLLLGALGGGGSVLAVPVLVYVLGQSPHEATAGALVVVTVGAVSGLLCHARAGRVRWASGVTFGALGTAGSYLGSRWSAAVPPAVLMAAFAGLMLVVAALLLLRGRSERRAARSAPPPRRSATRSARLRTPHPDHPNRPDRHPDHSDHHPDNPPHPDHTGRSRPPHPALRSGRVAVTASAVGLLTGFFGVGGGFVVVPALTLVLGLEMPVAIGTSLLVILLNSLTALATRAGTGALDWPLLAGFAACAAVGSHLGNRLTNRLPTQVLTTAFATLVTLLALTTAAAAVPRLWPP
ncbi:sulfite exporter TauE/SafE family protein [Streptomyces sp. NRRL S-337]|uniref:sulfite exporter TauE/SafE family protein n=1 Tax=Streptomyces sp. NRRL S-337 TaxID=1463900 RepID=UPI0004CA5362|nr:sulfite exporter TauE/SafE family protein [Streptomyces sp. NRRL S-337]